MISAATSTQELFVAAARKHLCVGRTRPSEHRSVDLAAQVLAVDLGLKPALLYDSNGASAEQLQLYLRSLQASRLVSDSILTLDLNGNALIVHPVTVISNLEQVLHGEGVAVIDVCPSLEQPTVTEPLTAALRSTTQDLLLCLRGCEQPREAEKPLCVGKKCEEWNLCTVFGLLLGYPVTYWFDQTKSFENCLSMTPLMVTTAAATWQTEAAGHTCRLYSFSVPEVLREETRSNFNYWKLRLQERFQKQDVLQSLTVCQTTVTLPSVCL